jgi:flagellar motor switch protein FliM
MRVEMDDRGGNLELVLPYATIEPIRDLLLQMFWGEKFGRDSIWESHLAGELCKMSLNIEAVLDEQVLPLDKVASLRLGDTLMLQAQPNLPVVMRCGRINMFKGHMGRAGNKVAIRVDETFLGRDEAP